MLPTETSYRSFNRLVTNDFVISQPKAWEGAMARVPPQFEGWFLSPVFPTFRANTVRLDPLFLDWFCRRQSVWLQLLFLSRGIGARRETVSPENFLSLEIPLPSLPEQRRAVARIEDVAGLVEDARVLQRAVDQELLNTARALILNDPDKTSVPLSELVRLRSPDVAVQPNGHYEFAGVYSFGRGLFRGQRRSGADFSYRRLTRLRAGDFVYPKLMAWEGAFGVVPSSCAGCVVSTEFPVFEILVERVLPDVLDVYFRDPAVWPAISGASMGTNVRRRRLNPQDFLRWKMPLPSRRTQQSLRDVMISTAAVGKLRSESAAALDALLPAVLDRAFRGEL